MKKAELKIVFVGGGTMGPVSPLLALATYIKHERPQTSFLFIGTRTGPERDVVVRQGIVFKSVLAGKLRRYWSLKNLLMPILTIVGFFQSLFVLSAFKPDVVVGAGGFVQVPVMYAAWVLRIPVTLHQQDVEVTLSNSLCAPIASKITVTFEHSTRDFSQGLGLFARKHNKVLWTGNPVRYSASTLPAKNEALEFFKLQNDVPVILIIGGSSGAEGLNRLIDQSCTELTTFAQVIHSTGQHKSTTATNPHYHAYPFIERMDMAYAAADIVVSRAGLSAISELSAVGKPSVIIPMPATHQESNAAMLYSRKAAVVLDQNTTEPPEFVKEIRTLLIDGERQKALVENMHEIMPAGATGRIAEVLYSLQ